MHCACVWAQERFLSYNDFAGSPEPEPAPLGRDLPLDSLAGGGGVELPAGGPLGGAEASSLPEPIE
jgi:hypothetical protein